MSEPVDSNSPQVGDAYEHGFRRGYKHAVVSMREVIDPLLTKSQRVQLDSWIDDAVVPWVEDDEAATSEFPPAPPNLPPS